MQILDVEQGSIPWHQARWGKVTGSRLDKALGSKTVQTTLKMELISERMCQNEIDNYQSKSMEWGTEQEPFAIAKASEVRGIEYHKCGMMVSEEIENFGFSPDGVYFDDNNELIGGIECKCPNSSTHVRYMLDGAIPKQYLRQVQCPFLISDKIQWWDFISYDSRNYSRDNFMVRLHREDIKDLDEMREKLIAFLNDVNLAHQSLIF